MTSSPARRFWSTTLVVVATVLAFCSVYAVWAQRQALDGPAWADTSTRILNDGQVRLALATYLADQLVADPGARQQIGAVLLTPEQQSAANAVDLLHAAIVRSARQALVEPAAERAWRDANVLAHRELVDLVEGKPAGAERGGTVVLDLRALVRVLAAQIKLDPALVDQLPQDTTQLRVVRPGEVTDGQDALRAVRGLAVVLPLLTLAVWALALLIARGRRRVTVAQIAVGLIVMGAGVLLTRTLTKTAVLDGLVLHAADRDAADHAWSIATTLLRDCALAALAAGVVLLVTAGLLGRRERDGSVLLDQLAELERLRGAGAISTAEYEWRRRQLLAVD